MNIAVRYSFEILCRRKQNLQKWNQKKSRRHLTTTLPAMKLRFYTANHPLKFKTQMLSVRRLKS